MSEKKSQKLQELQQKGQNPKLHSFQHLLFCEAFTFLSPQTLEWLNLLPIADLQVSKNLKRKDRSTFSHFSLLSQS